MTQHPSRIAGAIAAALTVLPLAAQAETIKWKDVGAWDISFYPGSEGCQAFAVFEEGTAFFIGFDNTDDLLALDVTLIDSRWSSIEDGKEYPITVKFGNETPWTLDMNGILVDDYPGLNIMIDAGKDQAALFVDEFQRKTSMEWSYSGSSLGRYTLSGSRRAFDEVVACQQSYFQALEGQSDPFAGGGSSTDPFSD